MHRVRRRAAAFTMVCAAVAVSAMLVASSASAAPAPKPDYSVSITPSILGGKTGTTVTATITNEALLQRVETVALAWPSTFQVVSASLPAGFPKPVLTTCKRGTTSPAAPCVQIRGLGLRPRASVVLTMTVNTPPTCANTTGTWTVVARSDLLFSLLNLLLGGTGNLTLDPASKLVTTATDMCQLQFGVGPTDSIAGQTITGTAFSQSGPALTVGIVDQSGLPVGIANAPISVALNGSGSLSGMQPATTNASGVATLSPLSVSAAGTADTLTASDSGSGIASGVSGPFDVLPANTVAAAVTPCSGASCSVTTGTPGTDTLTVSAKGGTSTTQGTLEGSIETGALNCGTPPPRSLTEDPNTYTVLSSSGDYGKTVTITYPASFSTDTDEGSGSYDGDSDFDDTMVCFQAPYPFQTFFGVQASAAGGFYTGFLPDCASAGPCVDRAASTFAPAAGKDNFIFSMVVDIPADEPGDPRMN